MNAAAVAAGWEFQEWARSLAAALAEEADIDGALEKVSMLKGVTFDWCEDYIKERGGEDGYFIKKHDTGLIAQDVQQVLPEIVRKKKDGYLGVQYDKMVGLLVEAIKELRTEINELKSKR